MDKRNTRVYPHPGGYVHNWTSGHTARVSHGASGPHSRQYWSTEHLESQQGAHPSRSTKSSGCDNFYRCVIALSVAVTVIIVTVLASAVIYFKYIDEDSVSPKPSVEVTVSASVRFPGLPYSHSTYGNLSAGPAATLKYELETHITTKMKAGDTSYVDTTITGYRAGSVIADLFLQFQARQDQINERTEEVKRRFQQVIADTGSVAGHLVDKQVVFGTPSTADFKTTNQQLRTTAAAQEPVTTTQEPVTTTQDAVTTTQEEVTTTHKPPEYAYFFHDDYRFESIEYYDYAWGDITSGEALRAKTIIEREVTSLMNENVPGFISITVDRFRGLIFGMGLVAEMTLRYQSTPSERYNTMDLVSNMLEVAYDVVEPMID